MFIPVIFAMVPHLIRFAEEQINGGQVKKKFVLDYAEKVYDDFEKRGLIPGWMNKRIALGLIDLLVEEVLPVIIKGKILSQAETTHQEEHHV